MTRPVILPHPEARALAQGWADATLSTQLVAPPSSAPSEVGMCSGEAGSWLAKAYGRPALSFEGKKIRAFSFGSESMLCFTSSRGTSWQMVHGPASDPASDGRSYGQHVLLAGQPQRGEPAFLNAFCLEMARQMRMDPAAARAEREAHLLDQAASAPARRAPSTKARI